MRHVIFGVDAAAAARIAAVLVDPSRVLPEIRRMEMSMCFEFAPLWPSLPGSSGLYLGGVTSQLSESCRSFDMAGVEPGERGHDQHKSGATGSLYACRSGALRIFSNVKRRAGGSLRGRPAGQLAPVECHIEQPPIPGMRLGNGHFRMGLLDGAAFSGPLRYEQQDRAGRQRRNISRAHDWLRDIGEIRIWRLKAKILPIVDEHERRSHKQHRLSVFTTGIAMGETPTYVPRGNCPDITIGGELSIFGCHPGDIHERQRPYRPHQQGVLHNSASGKAHCADPASKGNEPRPGGQHPDRREGHKALTLDRVCLLYTSDA